MHIMTVFHILLLTQIVWCTTANYQEPEINDQFLETTNETKNDTPIHISLNTTINTTTEPSAILRIYNVVTSKVKHLIWAPKMQSVLRNIGTCVVNGAMELITFYFPAPIIPLLASAAGMLIPFEPVVMLRRQMPVTSYRRAFNSAVNGFLNTFDGYKSFDEDPYMTRQFYRRVMNGSGERPN